jgi:hypothetical protein
MPLQLNKKEQFFPERGVINGKLKESNKLKQESILRFIFKTLKGIKSAFNSVTHFQLNRENLQDHETTRRHCFCNFAANYRFLIPSGRHRDVCE